MFMLLSEIAELGNVKKRATQCAALLLFGSEGWVRTNDQLINSQLLYH
jgi:hypothetical protein